MSQQTVFVREYYQKDTHFNPVTFKIGPNILKKAHARTSPPHNHQIQQSNQLSPPKTATRNQETLDGNFSYARTASPMKSEDNAKYKASGSQVYPADEVSYIAECQRTFLMNRNKELQRELKDRESRISELGRKCEQLQMQLVAVSGNSVDHSSNWSETYNFSKSVQSSMISEHSNSHLQKLKSIRDRLQKIDFSRFISANNVGGRVEKTQ